MFKFNGVMALTLCFALAACGKDDTPKQKSASDYVVEGLKSKRDACQKAVTKLEAMDVVRISGGTYGFTADYDERLWASLEHDDKVRQALLVYCSRMPESGMTTVVIKGRHDGKTMASITNGDYWDN